MARSKRSRRSSGFNSQKLMKIVRMAALGAPAIAAVSQYGFTKDAAITAIKGYTGINPNNGQFDAPALIAGWTPYLASILITNGIPKISGILRGL